MYSMAAFACDSCNHDAVFLTKNIDMTFVIIMKRKTGFMAVGAF